MRLPIALACLACCVFAGCAYKAGVGQETLNTEYQGDIKYSADDMSAERAEWGIAVFRINRTIGPGCESRSTVQEYEKYVPYKIGAETGNFFKGVASIIMMPITLPLFALSGSEGRILGDHLKQIGNNLNVFQAAPPNEEYLFNTPVKEKPIGKRQTAWRPVSEASITPMASTRVELRIDSLSVLKSGQTDDRGVVVFDIRSAAEQVKIPEGENFAEVSVQLVIRGAGTAENLPTINITIRMPRKPLAP
jgi:hypothetical protein